MTSRSRAICFALAVVAAGCRRTTPTAPPMPAPVVDAGQAVAAAPVTARDAAADVVGALPSRTFLMRFGDYLLPMLCRVGGKLASHEVCFGDLPPVATFSTNRAYRRDGRPRTAARGLFTCSGSEEEEVGYVLRPTARPPAGEQARWAEPGSMDGWGVWPPGAFDVTLTAYGRADLHESILWRCDLADWWPCTKATRDALKSGPDGGASPVPSHRNTFKGSPLTRAREAQVRRALGHYLERLAAREDGGPAPLSLLTTLNLDLAGDGNPVRVYNVAITGFQVRESDAEYVELPGELYFLFREQDGEMVRLELTGKVPLGEPDFPIDGAVLGTFDIDGDGVPELWLDVPYVEGTTWQIVHPVNGRLERLASYTCGT